jgi:hypothetical protein
MRDREKWMELCRQASREQDLTKLLELTAEIVRHSDEKEDRFVPHGETPASNSQPQA